MKRIVGALFSLMIILPLFACGNRVGSENPEEISTVVEVQSEKEQSITTQEAAEQSGKLQETVQEPENDSLDEQEADVNTKALVVYFSCTGTTELVAEYVSEILEANLYEIVAEEPYTEADLAYYTNGRADQEQNDSDVRLEISGGVENMDEYNTIVLGYPIWRGQVPRIISTFLESYDFSGKTMIPFCTSHSSGIGSSAVNLHALCSGSAEWTDGRRFESRVSKESVEEWIREINLDKTT